MDLDRIDLHTRRLPLLLRYQILRDLDQRNSHASASMCKEPVLILNSKARLNVGNLPLQFLD